MLPDDSPIKVAYDSLLQMPPGKKRDIKANTLTDKMIKGSIDVNIMVKLDRINRDRKGNILSPEFSDAKAALRGSG